MSKENDNNMIEIKAFISFCLKTIEASLGSDYGDSFA